MGLHRASVAPVCLAPPKPGDFCCTPAGGDLGKAILVAQRLAGNHHPEYEHAEVFVGQADARGPYGYTYSAYPDNGTPGKSGKRALPASPERMPGYIWSSGIINLTEEQRMGVVSWCVTHPDVQYSWEDYGALVMHHLHVPSPGLRDYIVSTRRMICSYYTDTAMCDGADVHLFQDGRWPGDVTPGDLADMLITAAHIQSLTPQE